MAGADNAYFWTSLEARSLEPADKRGTQWLHNRVPDLLPSLQNALDVAAQAGEGGYVRVTDSQPVQVSQSVTVPAGTTLEIMANAQVTFTSGASLTVDGALIVTRATLDFVAPASGNGIHLNAGSSGTIDRSTISNATYGVFFDSGSSGTINEGTITNTSEGVHFSGGSSGTVESSTIIGVGSGIVFTGGIARIENTTIEDATYGVRLSGSSEAEIYDTSIENTDRGIQVSAGAAATIDGTTIDDATYGIRFEDGSSGSVRFSAIKNATYGIYAIDVLPTIEYSTIEDNNTGLALHYVNSTAQEITGNHIRDNTQQGISLDYSSVRIGHNWIYPNTNGINAVYSTPWIYDNEIYDNDTGLNMAFYSPAKLRRYSTGGGYNLIYSNSTNTKIYADYNSNVSGYGNDIHSPFGYAVRAARNASVQMPNNYWAVPGPSAFYATGSAQIVYLPESDEPFVTPEIYATADRSLAPLPEGKLAAASELMLRDQYEEAIALYVDVLGGESADRDHGVAMRQYVLAQLAECYRAAGKGGFGRFLHGVVRPKLGESPALHVTTLELESLFLIREGRHDEALEILERLGEEYAAVEEGVRERALFGQAYVHGVILADTEQGRRYARQLAAEYPSGVLAAHAQRLVGAGESKAAPRLSANVQRVSLEHAQAPERYALLGNYPNPFNPSTTLCFALPEAADVRVLVFDVLGREVMRPVDGHLAAGTHEVRVEASHLPSGVYLYRMETPSFTETRRMVLTR